MKNVFYLLSISSMMFLASCGSNSTKTNEADSAATASADAKTYKIDPAASKVSWSGTKLFGMGEHHGTIAIQSGSMSVENGNISAGNILIDMKTIKPEGMDDAEGVKKLLGHLQSPDFFDVGNYPTAKFVITGVEEKKSGENTHVITGNLTLRDTSLSISFPAKVGIEGGKVHANGKVVIDRFKWHVMYDSEKHKGKLSETVVRGTKGGVVAKDLEIDFHLIAAAE